MKATTGNRWIKRMALGLAVASIAAPTAQAQERPYWELNQHRSVQPYGQLYQHEFWDPARAGTPSPWHLQLLPTALAMLVLAAGLWPEPLLALSRDAAAALSTGGHR